MHKYKALQCINTGPALLEKKTYKIYYFMENEIY